MKKISKLRIYKPDGEILEFEVGDKTKEGKIKCVEVMEFAIHPNVPKIVYSNGTEARFYGFPYAVHLE